MYPNLIQKVIDVFSKFPSVGRRSACRFAYYLAKMPQTDYENLIKSIENLRKGIKTCNFCFNSYDANNLESQNLCPICFDSVRDKSTICIIEKESDLMTIENTKIYKGLYFIIGGTVYKLRKEDLEKLRISELQERIANPGEFVSGAKEIQEVIIATNPTVEGVGTGLLIERKINATQMSVGKKLPKITRLARGLPLGAELEYADEETLLSALEGRK